MKDVFGGLVGMSITASIVVAAVIILRLCMKRAPKRIVCLLWLTVAIRLVCPFSLKCRISLVPETDMIRDAIQSIAAHHIHVF